MPTMLMHTVCIHYIHVYVICNGSLVRVFYIARQSHLIIIRTAFLCALSHWQQSATLRALMMEHAPITGHVSASSIIQGRSVKVS